MAGIGFELRRMMEEQQSLVSKIRGYASAGLISSGPWLMTIFTLGVLTAFSSFFTTRQEFELFRGLITYAFAYSLILVGVLQMTVTRRVADLLYTKKFGEVLPAFNASVLVTGVVQAVIGTAFCVVAGLPANLSFVAVSLYVVISLTWLALIWLGVTREYDEVLKAYGVGSFVVFGIVALLDKPATARDLLTAYTLGQSLILVLLIRTIVRGLETGGARDFGALKSVGAFPILMLVGLTYNMGIWVDKMMFWYTDGIGPHPLILFHPLYDTCCFLAYLTVIPALAVNLVRVETSFYECYRAYFGAILGGMPLKVIHARRDEMFQNLRESAARLIRIQGAITLACMLFAPYIMDALHLPDTSVRIFRAVCLGAFFHVLLLITILMQLYFDLQRQALITSAGFLALNALLAGWSVAGGIGTYGYGYALATLIALIVGYSLLARSVDYLDYFVFTSQPIGGERKKAEKREEGEEEEEEAATPPATKAEANEEEREEEGEGEEEGAGDEAGEETEEGGVVDGAAVAGPDDTQDFSELSDSGWAGGPEESGSRRG